MTSCLSGVELYGGSKLLGIPFFPQFTKLMDSELHLRNLLREKSRFITDGMSNSSDEKEKDGEERPRPGIPLHRSPAVFAALCAIGKETDSNKVTEGPTESNNKTSENKSAKVQNNQTHSGKSRPLRHERGHHRSAPYSKHKLATTPAQLPSQTHKIKHLGSWDSLKNETPGTSASGDFMNKSFSAPEKLDEISRDRLRSLAIRNLAEHCVADQSIDSGYLDTSTTLPDDAPPSTEPIHASGSPQAISSTAPSSSRGRPASRQSSFRRLNIPAADRHTLSARDISLQRQIRLSLNTHGICVIDGFLGEEMGSRVASDMVRLHASGDCEKGELLGGKKHGESVRGDLISWVDGTEPGCKNVGAFVRKLDTIIASGAGVTSSYNICGGTKAMVARYPGNGARYQLHVDNPAKDGRCLTCIYYINKNWNTNTMGGNLRMHAQTSGKTANIAPQFDRIAIFYSDSRNPHEVLPTFADRYALTVWYFDRDERRKALERMDAIAKSVGSSKSKEKSA